jgi:hypothetical protein
MSQILPQKRSAALDNNNMSSTRPRPDPPSDNNATEDSSSQRYNRLLSILNKSFSQSRTKIESDGPALIKEVYGDMTSLFGGDNDNDNDDDGTTQLVNLLLGKLDTVHDRFKDETTTSVNNMEKLLSQHHIQSLLLRVENAIDKVEKADEEFNRVEEADKKSVLAAVESARTGSGSNAQKFTEYYTYQLKQEYLTMLQGELDTVTSDNEKMDKELQEKWGEWMEDLKEVKNALALLTQLGSSVGNDEEDEKEGGRGVDP